MNTRSRLIVVGVALIAVSSLVLSVYAAVGMVAMTDRVGELEETVTATSDSPDAASSGNGTGSAGSTVASSGVLLAFDRGVERGVTVNYTITPVSQDGVFIDVTDLELSRGFQDSVVAARSAVAQSEYNGYPGGVAVGLTPPDRWGVIEGRSASLLFAAELVALTPQYELNESVALTGIVNRDGELDDVGFVGAKATAAAKRGKTVVITPEMDAPVHTSGDVVIRQVNSLEEALAYALDEVTEDS